jgi:hypothetical protein
LASDIPAGSYHLATVAVSVQIELIQTAVAVVDAALLELLGVLEFLGGGRAFRRRFRLAAVTEALAICRAFLLAPKRAKRILANAHAARHA